MRVLITSGGTKVPIDRVRDITNMSSGTFGSRIAHEALVAGHDVTFLCAKHSKTPFTRVFDYANPVHWDAGLNQWSDFWNFCETYRGKYHESRFRNFDDYAQLLEQTVRMNKPDVVILAAAVSDYGVSNFVNGKARTGDQTSIELFPLTKLIGRIKQWHPDCLLVGFKLLMYSTNEQLFQAAWDSVINNGCDVVVANDLRDLLASNHRLMIVTKQRELRIYQKSDSDNPYYLARKVIEEMESCHKESFSVSPAA